MQSKRSQMEILGLVVIIILIAIGMLFAVQFLIKKPTGKSAAAVKESVLAANFLNSMLSTTTACNSLSVKELLQDCALTSGAVDCNGVSSCYYAGEQIGIMLERTMKKWNKEYYFSIAGAYDVEQINFGSPCPGEKESKTHPVPVRPGFEIKLILDICG
ncbi:MAG: hypothetical protein QW666_04645 [Candidatus Woesearchaeota archaeon]